MPTIALRVHSCAAGAADECRKNGRMDFEYAKQPRWQTQHNRRLASAGMASKAPRVGQLLRRIRIRIALESLS